jgi:hypothetical protein
MAHMNNTQNEALQRLILTSRSGLAPILRVLAEAQGERLSVELDHPTPQQLVVTYAAHYSLGGFFDILHQAAVVADDEGALRSKRTILGWARRVDKLANSKLQEVGK